MVNFTSEEEQKAYKEFRKVSSQPGQGMNFHLLMKQDGVLKPYSREHQPCQGGEMRKYRSSHPGDCTRPQDGRPGDLQHRFPEGEPVAIGRSYADLNMDRRMIEDILSEGPYRKIGLETTDVISDKDRCLGIVVMNLDVDPTLLVSMFQYINTVGHHHQVYHKMVGYGLTKAEALCSLMLWSHDPRKSFGETYSYYFPTSASIRRIVEGDPHDLSADPNGQTGTFRQRYDYNRPEIQNLFRANKAEGEKVTIWQREMIERQGVKSIPKIAKDYYGPGKDYAYDHVVAESLEEYCRVAKEIITDGMKEALPHIEQSSNDGPTVRAEQAA